MNNDLVKLDSWFKVNVCYECYDSYVSRENQALRADH